MNDMRKLIETLEKIERDHAISEGPNDEALVARDMMDEIRRGLFDVSTNAADYQAQLAKSPQYSEWVRVLKEVEVEVDRLRNLVYSKI